MLKYSFKQEMYLDVRENFWLLKVKSEYVKDFQVKGLKRKVSTIASCLLCGGHNWVLVLDAKFPMRLTFTYSWYRYRFAILSWFSFIWKWYVGWLVKSKISIVKMWSYKDLQIVGKSHVVKRIAIYEKCFIVASRSYLL